MFFETRKVPGQGPAQGLLAVKVEAAKKKIATVPRKPRKKTKSKGG